MVNNEYINKKGEKAMDYQYTPSSSFAGGMARVVEKSKYGYINQKGKCIVEPTYGKAYDPYDDGYAIVVNSDKKYEIINSKGEKVAGPYDGIGDCSSKFCTISDCYYEAYYDNYTHCVSHKNVTTSRSSSSSSSSTYHYCNYYGCTNKVYSSTKKYCTTHSYLEK
jgi:hypothetical protein